MDELRGGSRDGAVNRSLDSIREIEPADVQSPVPIAGHRRGHSESQNLLPSPSSPTTRHARARGLSESQNLLPLSPTKLFEYSTTRTFRYNPVEPLRQEGTISPLWAGEPQTLTRTKRKWWRDLVVDVVSLSAGLPFFALAGAVIYFDKKPVHEHQENILKQCISGVS